MYQHLTNACRAAEVSVDLEGRVGIEQIGEGAAGMTCARLPVVLRIGEGQQFLLNMVGLFAILQTCP